MEQNPLEIDPQMYITSRLKQYQSWYDRKAVQCKSTYLRNRVTSVVLGALVPVIINFQFPYSTYVSTICSLIVVILVSLEGILHYRELWKNYRSTEQFLGRELVCFETKTGPYGMTDMNDRFTILVNRVEGAIASENSATLNTMTLGPGHEQEAKAV